MPLRASLYMTRTLSLKNCDLPPEFSLSLQLHLDALPQHVLSILHLHGFHSFIECLPPTIIYPTFCRIFLFLLIRDHNHYLKHTQLPTDPNSPSPLFISTLADRLSSPSPPLNSSTIVKVEDVLDNEQDRHHTETAALHRYLPNSTCILSASSHANPFPNHPPLPSLNALGVIIWVIIKKTVPTIPVPSTSSLLQVILPPLVFTPNATFVIAGDMVAVSPLSKSADTATFIFGSTNVPPANST
ncbi:hypothetical protein HD554DRAFT_2177409 [Boletus coccyginus]|nr:hypothetical protein HD554DRAFT_2177409 [Boletus coccyginus]